MTAEGRVTSVTPHPPRAWQRFVRTEVCLQTRTQPVDGIIVDIWEEPGKCYLASLCDRARELEIPVRVTYYETRQKFLRCTDVRFLEKTDVPQAEAHQPTGA